ncbi:hypothetical protein ABKY47_004010 [Aeromonas hydrophila]
MFKTLLLLSALLLSACTPEPKQDPYHPYECFNLDKQESEWRCTFNGEPINKGEQHTMNLNIKNGMKGREAQ